MGGITAHGVRLYEVDAGPVVDVIGLGLVGQLTALLARAAGSRAIAVNISLERVALAKDLGGSAALEQTRRSQPSRLP